MYHDTPLLRAPLRIPDIDSQPPRAPDLAAGAALGPDAAQPEAAADVAHLVAERGGSMSSASTSSPWERTRGHRVEMFAEVVDHRGKRFR